MGRYAETRISGPLSEAMSNPSFLRLQRFRPSGKVAFLRASNPYEDTPRDPEPLVGSFVVGLTSGFGEPKDFEPEDVREIVMREFPAGGSVVVMLGWWEGAPEDSARVLIENTKETCLSEPDFRAKVRLAVAATGEALRQRRVMLDFYRGGRVLDSVNLDWTAP